MQRILENVKSVIWSKLQNGVNINFIQKYATKRNMFIALQLNLSRYTYSIYINLETVNTSWSGY